MSAITIDNELVHYEVLGRGRPVILLHGWLGSWRYWVPCMQQLSMKYRTYAVDLWGFGDSGKDTQRFGFEAHVRQLHQFMEKLGISKTALVGHGLGGAVAARFAARQPERVPRMMVVCPPLFRIAPSAHPLTSNPPPREQSLTAAAVLPALDKPRDEDTPTPGSVPAVHPEAETIPWRSNEMHNRIVTALESREADRLKALQALDMKPQSPFDAAKPPTDRPSKEITSPPLPESLPDIPQMPKVDYFQAGGVQVQKPNPLKDHLQNLDPMALLEKHVESGSDREKLKAELVKAAPGAIEYSIESFAGVDTLRDMSQLSMPILMLYGLKDTLIPVPDPSMIVSLTTGRKTFRVMGLDDTHHFPMLEDIVQFNRLLMGFLEAPDVSQLKITDIWERRVR
ncbi:MAG: alpha/beta hydrolase [Anaerolineae bacterium]|nr:alpha/beta hydrolase [Anaerolineae bacterium]